MIAGPHETSEEFAKREHHCFQTIYSDKHLSFFQGGCTWIEGDTVTVQLRKRYEKKERLFFLYSKQEILNHERVHALRMKFDEKRFEEILAYRTSASRFRAYFGPLFRTPFESGLFLFGCLTSALVNLFYMPLALLSFAGLASFFLIRLVIDQRVFTRTFRSFKTLLGCDEKALNALMYLTDKEIEYFSTRNTAQIRSHIETLNPSELRLRQFTQCFLR